MKPKREEIWYYNNGRYERERICAEKWMRLVYESPLGGATLPFVVKRKLFSRLYGMYCQTKFSAKKIPQFIKDNQVDMTGCTGNYKNFAEFFAREKNNISFPDKPEILGSPCEGLISAYTDIVPEKLIAAKGSYFSLAELFGDDALAKDYHNGTMIKIRLTPANYHRMHFFDSGKIAGTSFIDGDLYSVSPLALSRIVRLYCRNKRALILFSSQNFGNVVIVEVGATFVGSIIHCFDKDDKDDKDDENDKNNENGENEYVHRGQLASYFMPGGSLVLLFFKRGAFMPKDELIIQTNKGYETKIHVGDAL